MRAMTLRTSVAALARAAAGACATNPVTGERELALAARELAWGEETPVPASTQPLTVDVRRVVAERSNGHAR